MRKLLKSKLSIKLSKSFKLLNNLKNAFSVIAKNSLRYFSRKGRHISYMRFTTIIYISYRNLMANKLRSFLTIGGVGIGIGIVTFLICIGFGIQKMIINEVIKKNPIDVIDVNNEKLDNLVYLDESNIKKIKKINGVKDIAVRVNTGGKLYLDNFQTDVIIYGTNKKFFKLSNTNVKYGSLDVNSENGKMAVSLKVAKVLGFKNPKDIIGKHVKYDIILSRETNSKLKEEKNISNNEAEVVAVMKDNDAIVWFSDSYLKHHFDIDLAQEAKVSVDLNRSNIDEIRKNIEVLGFNTSSVVDIIKDINSFFLIIRIILIIFGTIIMSISAMGMLNTLSVSLLQRTKEVGILKALGAKRKDIFYMFIFEAATISFIGGTLGFLSGYGVAKAVNAAYNFFAIRQHISPITFIFIPNYFIIALVAFIAFLGLVTGIGPAYRAAHIHALDALRYE